MKIPLLGIGTALPSAMLEQQSIISFAKARCCNTSKQERLLESLYHMTEIRTRGSVLVGEMDSSDDRPLFYPLPADPSDDGPGTSKRMERYAQESVPLALSAARNALADSGLQPSEITHLITVSCTGFFAPGPDIALIKQLGLSPQTARLHVGFMGCHGALNALRQAQAIAAAQPDARVLICAVELCTLHMQYGWDANSLVANSLFADGSAAMVLCQHKRSKPETWNLTASGSCVLPDCEDAMTWRIGNHGFEMTLAKSVPTLIHQHLRPWMEEWLSSHGLTIPQVSSWAAHPGGPRILSETVRALDLPAESIQASQAVLAECGNMSSPTIVFILDRLRKASAPLPCVALGFGPGLSVETALFTGTGV
jgi:predicted naringenin-chalcone synthase